MEIHWISFRLRTPRLWRTLKNYSAQRDDELSFDAGVFIRELNEVSARQTMWFNFCRVEHSTHENVTLLFKTLGSMWCIVYWYQIIFGI